MTLAADFPILGLFWTFLWLYLLIAWLMLMFQVVVGIFRNTDIGGAAKAVWLLAIIVFPLIGVAVYVIRHGEELAWGFGPSDRDKRAAVMAYSDRGLRYHDRPISHY